MVEVVNDQTNNSTKGGLLMNSIIDNLLSGQADFDNFDDLLNELVKNFIERWLQAEITEFLGYEKHASDGNNSGNSRNGSY